MAPPTGLETERYPYLALVAERLADTHLTCTGRREGVEVYRFLRCEAGWQWGGPGSHCPEPTEEVYALVPSTTTCLAVPAGALRVAAIDDTELGEATWCSGERLSIPQQGLLVEPRTEGAWWSEVCGG